MIHARTYQSPKSAQHAEGREERDRQVASIAAKVRPLKTATTHRVVWNDCLLAWVEVRR